MKKKKPFSPYSKPYAPGKPRETYPQSNLIESINVDKWSETDVSHLVGELKTIGIEIEYDDYESHNASVTVNFYREPKIVANPNYEKELAKYEEKYAQYKADMKEWNAQKKIYDAQQKQAVIDHEKQELERLKAKYGG